MPPQNPSNPSQPGQAGIIPKPMTWPERVANSGGRAFMLPEKFHDKAKEWVEKNAKFQKFVNEMAEIECEQGLLMQNLLMEARKHFHENGVENVWVKDIGFDQRAMDEGEFVLNITSPTGVGR